ncbi:hypothetical protein X747_14765 [Mesorhizobium sp. LNJC384A00]|uniref:hypothetical protein n=1 Tax=Mesorhizobium sp. LNJC384A00 TaxID=1287268 RepID=UPI0003CE21AC|nr:hypothetical protein [Mesorhizobium sp. LNJC384A00]ESY42039.1 hypothetical protein X747_14765 [Mesorhizobium sp. LNJC384A00]
MQTAKILDQFEQTIQASRALNWMLFCTHLQGDSLTKERDGIHTLLETQADLYEAIVQQLAAAEKQTATDRIAEIKNSLSDRAGRQLMQEDTEQAARDRQSAKLDAELAGHETTQSPDEMREQFIADHARRGVSVPAIAEALNMKEAAVAKLVGQLLGTDRRSPRSSGGKAVNE